MSDAPPQAPPGPRRSTPGPRGRLRALVVGPGALGLLFASRLAGAGGAVTLLDRDPERARRLAAGGIARTGEGPDARVAVGATAEPAGLAPDLVLVCVKAGASEAVAGAVRRLAGAPTLVVFQNGLGGAEALARALGARERVVVGLTEEAATRTGEARVRHAGRGPTLLAPLTPAGAERAQAAARALRPAGFEVTVAHDLRQAQWSKLRVNAAINALTGLLGCANGGLLAAPAAAALADRAAEEVAAVAAAQGISGVGDAAEARAAWRAVAAATASNLSSTLQDLRRNRPTEVFAINGAVAQAAREAGCAAPTNALLADLIAAREQLLEP